MKRFDFMKIGSSSFDGAVLHSSENCEGLVVDDNEAVLDALPFRPKLTKLKRAISLDDVEYIDDFGCHHVPLSRFLKEQEVGEVLILKISLGSSSCELLLKLFEYLEKENISKEYKPKHISFERTIETSSVEDLYTALRKAVALGYSVESQTSGYMVLNFVDY